MIHYYDTNLRRILCGLRGFEHRSTKHSRSVTCDACLRLLGKQPTTDEANTLYAPSGHVAP